ncbi:MAG TPA: hypothetical protein PLE45_06090 [Spirochaetota bacterium]|nr:hypothetical protein [Spirochaetota bacterium]HOL56835.1 hypothetical protein [Spirochaetota bacterium]HPP04269.1 hypothetical protein [Spirochaetota bacterium]
MKFKLKHADKIVGLFLLVCIVILFLSIILVIYNQKIFIKKVYFTSRFNDKIGLKINQDIFFKGFVIGKIVNYRLNSVPKKMATFDFEYHILAKITKKYENYSLILDFVNSKYHYENKHYLLEKNISKEDYIKLLKIFENIGFANSVEIDFFIYEPYINIIKENSVLHKASNPLSGATILLIPNSYSENIAKPGSFVPSLDIEEGIALLSKGEIKKQADVISNIIKSVEDILASINSDRNADQNSIARILVNTADSIEILKRELLKFENVINNFNDITYNFKSLSIELKDPDGMAKRLIDPEGDIMFNSIQKSLNSLSEMMDQLAKFSYFVNSQSKQIEMLLNQSRNTIKETQDVIEGIKNNPLIKGGITEKKSEETLQKTVREKDF